MALTYRAYADTSDFRIFSASITDYATARAGSNLTTEDLTSTVIGQSFATSQWNIWQYFANFSVSVASISSATLSINRTSANGNKFYLVKTRNWASQSTSEYIPGADLSGVTTVGSAQIGTGSGRVEITLSDVGTGKLVIVGQNTEDNVDPAGGGNGTITISTANTTGTTDDPYIDIVANSNIVITLITTGTGSVTVPTGCTSAIVEAWGASCSATSSSSQEAGGAGGGYAGNTVAVSGGNTLFYQVGATSAGLDGQASFVGDASTYASSTNGVQGGGGVIATRAGGTGAAKGTWATGASTFSGGDGAAAQGGGGGRGGSGGGGSAGPSGAGSNGTAGSGSSGGAGGAANGGSPTGGAGGSSGNVGTPGTDNVNGGSGGGGGGSTANGGNGGVPGGGGGGGGSSGGNFGAGARGQVRITFVAPPTSLIFNPMPFMLFLTM